MHEIRFDGQGEAVAIGEVDVTEHQFEDGDTILVQNELYRLVQDNWHFRNMVEDLYDHVQEEGWTGVGVITNADGTLFHAGVTTDDYGRHTLGNGHMCEVARLVSNGQAIEAALKEADLRAYRAEREAAEIRVLENAGLDAHQAANVLAVQRERGQDLLRSPDRERWFEGTEDVYLYDLGSEIIQREVLSLERAMADYPLLDEMAESEVMDEMWQKAFRDCLPRLDPSIDVEELEAVFRGELDSTCPECGWTKDIEEYLTESDEYTECNDCGDWFDVEADGTEEVPHPLCPTCGSDLRQRREEADELCQEMYGFDPSDGDGLVIRWNDGNYYFWNRNRSQWEIRMKLKDTYVVNE